MSVTVSSSSLSINNKLQQPEAASGVLEYAMKHFGELVSAFCFFLERQKVDTWLESLDCHLEKVIFHFCGFFL